ncbi:alpha/beta fold hydrolase [Rhizobium sp. BR 362]|uniref:alpha/beta fold hydrolase n=1 Tax=Rhizobium sp. BR 362 TaxID=3040670 RepID=UPI002F4251B7
MANPRGREAGSPLPDSGGASLSRRTVLLGAGALAAGAVVAEPIRALAAGLANPDGPKSWADPKVPELTHHVVETNGIGMHLVEQGSGPLVILLHGFPECWYSWRHQLTMLAEAGFRAVAPDLRGYGQSDCLQDGGKYTILDYIGDVVGLVDTSHVEQAVIAGHDFGATIAWQAALMRPDRFRAVIGLSAPFRPRGFGTSVLPTTVMPQNDKAVYYQLYLATPEAEIGMEQNRRQTLRSLFFHMSGEGLRAADPAAADLEPGMIQRRGAVLADDPPLPGWITTAELDVYVEEFTRSGFHGPLSWYRNIDRSWELLGVTQGAAVTIPALYMAGDRDFVVAANREFIPQQAKLVPKLHRPLILPGCGHWTQQERATDVGAAMIDFLQKL